MHAQSLINGVVQIHGRTATSSHSRICRQSGYELWCTVKVIYIHRGECNVKEVLAPLHLSTLPVHAGWLEGAAVCAASPVAVHLSQHSAGDLPLPEPIHMVQLCKSADMSGNEHIQCSRQRGTPHIATRRHQVQSAPRQ